VPQSACIGAPEEHLMTRDRLVTLLRWLARIWSFASVILLCAFLFGEGLPPLTFQAACFPFGVMLGLILAWWFERLGGLITLISVVLFYVLEYFGSGSLPKGFAFIVFAAPGILFLYLGFLRAGAVKPTGTTI